MFSLKNPSYPEYLCQAQSGVICVDIHPDHPHMLAAGLGMVSNKMSSVVTIFGPSKQSHQQICYFKFLRTAVIAHQLGALISRGLC